MNKNISGMSVEVGQSIFFKKRNGLLRQNISLILNTLKRNKNELCFILRARNNR
jgi:hypothetical protein